MKAKLALKLVQKLTGRNDALNQISEIGLPLGCLGIMYVFADQALAEMWFNGPVKCLDVEVTLSQIEKETKP